MGAALAADRRPARARRLRAALITLGVIALGVVIADVAARAFVQWRIEQSVREAMPQGVSGDVQAEVHGFSALWQLANRDFEHLTLTLPQLRAGELTLSAKLDGYGVALLDGGGMEQLRGSVTLPAQSVQALAQLPGTATELRLGEGTISYDTEVNLLGSSMGVSVDASVTTQGDRLLVSAQSVRLHGSGADVDATQWAGGPSALTIPICSAEHLPAGVRLTDVSVRPEGVTVTLSAQSVSLDEATLASRGTCQGG